MNDLGKVTQPHHYQHNGIETIDVIEAWTKDMQGPLAYNMGNAIKYISRWLYKNKEKDLLKVLWYLSRVLAARGYGGEAIETVQESVRRTNAEQPNTNQTRREPARGIRFSDG